MFTTIEAVRVNDPSDEVQLTPEQVWRALEMRARNQDTRFVPPGHVFELLDDEGDRLRRRVVLESRAEEIQKISFHGRRVVVFDFVEGPQRSVIVTTIETDDEGESWLRFIFMTDFPDIPAGSAEEKALAEQRRPMMRRQPRVVLKVARELAQEGRL